MQPISLGGPSLFCVVTIMSSMKLSGEIFAVQQSRYAVSKFELRRPSEHGENCWELFMTNENNNNKKKNTNMKKDDENSRPLNSVHASHVL